MVIDRLIRACRSLRPSLNEACRWVLWKQGIIVLKFLQIPASDSRQRKYTWQRPFAGRRIADIAPQDMGKGKVKPAIAKRLPLLNRL